MEKLRHLGSYCCLEEYQDICLVRIRVKHDRGKVPGAE